MMGCKEKQEPLPEKYPHLLITRISFSGIPDKDVTIDQPNRTIHVKMPAILTIANLLPIAELSPDAKISSQDRLADIGRAASWSYPNANNLTIPISSITNPNQSVIYQIKPSAKAPLEITQTKALSTFAIADSSDIDIEVKNAYGNDLPKLVNFTHRKTGIQHTLSNVFIHSYLDKIRVRAYSVPFVLGEYDITFQMENGTVMPVNQVLKTVQGKSGFSFNWSLSALAGETLTVWGNNLFEGSTAFRIRTLNGVIIPVSATYALDGRQVGIAVPAALGLGNYGIEILRDGLPVGKGSRLSIVKNKQQPYIIGLSTVQLPGELTAEPVSLFRNQKINVMFSVIAKFERYVFMLQDESTGKSVFHFPLTFPVEASPHVTIPPDVPAGRYKAFIREVDPETKEVIQQSEPFERTVVLQ